MLSKNNKYLKQTKEGTKVESYSIKKFKVGAASVVVGASIFFGAGVAAASEDVANNTTADNTTNAASEEAPKAVAVETTAVEAPKQATTEEVAAAVTANEETVVAADKTTLEENIAKLEKSLSEVDTTKVSASTLSKAKVQLENAKEVLENKNATQEEVDAAAKKASEQNFVISSMPKAGAVEKEVKEGANSIQNTGSHDPRNGQSMSEGEALRANSNSTDASSTTTSAKEELAKKVKILDEVLKNTDITKNLDAQLLTDSFATLKAAQDVLNNDSATESEIENATRKASNDAQLIFKQIPLTSTSAEAIAKAATGSGVGVLVDTKESANPNMDDANGAVIKQGPPTVVHGKTLQPTSVENQYTFAYMPPLYLEYTNVAPEDARTLYIRGSRSKDTSNTDVLVEIVRIADNTVLETHTLKAGENYKSTAMTGGGYGVYIGYDTSATGSQSIGKIVSYLASYPSQYSLGSFEIPREADYTTKYMTVDGKEIATYTLKGWSDQISEPSGVREFTNYKYIDTVVNSTPELNVDELDSIERLASSYGAKVLRKVVKPDGTVVKSFWIKDPTLDSSKIAPNSGSDTTGYIKLFETDEIAPWSTNTNLNFFYGDATKMSNGEVLLTKENADKIKELAAQVVPTTPIFNGASENTVRIYTNPDDENVAEANKRTIEIGFVGNFESVRPYGVVTPGKSLYFRNRTIARNNLNFQLVPLYNDLLFVPEITYIYDQAASVVVNYTDPNGNNVIDPVTVVDKVEVSKKTPYNTTSYKKDTITDKDGNIYYLKGVKEGSSPEEGTLDSLGVRTISYVYEKAGNVVVKYETTDGTQLTGELTFDDATSKTDVPAAGLVDETNAKPGTPYSTTDHKPAKITTADGTVYYLVGIDADKSVYDNDTPTNATDDEKVSESGVVKSGTTTVTYKYEKAGSVTINYIATDGTVLQGPVKDVVNGKPGTAYDTTENSDSKEERPTVISTGGKVYRLVQTSGTTTTGGVTYDANGVATGKGYSATTGTVEAGVDKNVTYVYEEVKFGDVDVAYINTKGEKIADTENVISGYEVGSEYTTTPKETITVNNADGTTTTYRLVKKAGTTTTGVTYDANGVATGKDNAPATGDVTETKQTVTYVYEEVVGSVEVKYIDEAGNPISGTTTGIAKTTVDSTEKDVDAKGNEVTNVAVGTKYDTTDLRPETITTAEGKVYKLLPKLTKGNETGDVVEGTTTVTYVYQEVKGNVEVNYVDENNNPIAGTTTGIAKQKVESVEKDVTDASNGTSYDTSDLRPETITTADGTVYHLVGIQNGSAPESGDDAKVAAGETKKVTYVYQKAGSVTINYIATDGTVIKTPVKDVVNGKPGDRYNAAEVDTTKGTDERPTTITTADGKTYKLVTKAGTTTTGVSYGANAVATGEGHASISGLIESGKDLQVTYVYEEVKGNVVVENYDTEGNKLGETKDVTPTISTGTDYTAKPEDKIEANGKTYFYKEVKSDSAPESGKVKEGTTTVKYVYEEAGSVVVNYVDEKGNVIKEQEKPTAYTNVKGGTEYDTTKELRPATITTADGKTYKLVAKDEAGKYSKDGLKEGSAAASGKVTSGKTTEVTYVYQEVKNGAIEVAYINTDGKEIAPKEVAVEKEEVGKDYTTTPKQEIKVTNEDGTTTTYRLVKKAGTTDTGVTYDANGVATGEGNAPQTGKVTEETQKVTYVYEAVKGSVIVNYVDENNNPIAGTTTGIAKTFVKKSEEDVTNVNAGSKYDTKDLRPETITTVEGKVYKLVQAATKGNETGEVVEGTTEVTYVYEEVKGNVIVKYYDEAGKEIAEETKAYIDASTGTDYETAPIEKITAEDGTVYYYKEVKADSDASKGKVEKETTTVKYVYEKAGSVVVNYVDEKGNVIKAQEKPKAYTNVKGGTGYDTTKELRPATITTADGKTYELVPQATKGNEKGNVVSGQTIEVTYTYKEVQAPTEEKGNVVVHYVVKNADGTTTELQKDYNDLTNAPVGTKYNTAENETEKPTTIKKDGKTYKLVTVVGNETGEVAAGTTEVTYVYQEVQTPTTDVVTNFVEKGTRNVLAPSEKGKQDPKAIDGYKLIGTEVDPKGNVTHIYEKAATPATKKVTKYIEEGTGTVLSPEEKGKQNPKEISGYELVRTYTDESGNTVHVYKKVTNPETEKVTKFVDENGNPVASEEKGNQPKKEVNGYEFVRTYTDENGNTVHVYKKVTNPTPTPTVDKHTSYVDVDGNEIRPTEEGTQPMKDITGYEFVETKVDEKGNTVHVYRKVVTPTPVNPVTPEQPSKPETPAKPTVVKEGKQLPNTDASSNSANTAAGVGLIGMVAAAIAARRRKNK